jgi:hypothetical protein
MLVSCATVIFQDMKTRFIAAWERWVLLFVLTIRYGIEALETLPLSFATLRRLPTQRDWLGISMNPL